MPPDTSSEPTQLGNYDVLTKIAEGGMGTVYKGRHRGTGDIVAIKVISPGPARNPVLLQRFEREFQAAKVLDHPNVVRAIEYCSNGPHPFLVMEFVDGESIGQRIERGGPIPEADAIRLIAQVCDGLQRAHKQGLVHRDVKPDNILITRDGVAKLTDMGLVKDIDTDLNLTKTGRGLGTPHYMAPEQFRNAKTVDIRGDVYSLGATLYAMVTGTVPFDRVSPLDCWMRKIRNEFPPPKELVPELSDRIDWAIRRSMSAEPNQRPASCREFIEDLTGQTRFTGAGAQVQTGAADVWYLVYKDETGQAHTVKGGTTSIRRALQDGLLGDTTTIVVGRTKFGQFMSLQSVPEFRDLVIAPAPLPPPGWGGRTGSSENTPRVTPESGGKPRRPSDGKMNVGSKADEDSTARPKQPSKQSVPAPGSKSRPRTPSPPRVSVPTPRPGQEPHAETAPYPTKPTSGATRRPQLPAKKGGPPQPGFNWTPILVVLVALASAALGFYIFTR